VNAKLVRVLLPLIIVAIFIQGFLDESIMRLLHINEVLFTLLLSLAVAAITIFIVIQLSRKIFSEAEMAEIERRRAEERNLQLASIIDSTDDAIIGKTLDGIITNWNSGAEKMYGYTKDEAINQPISIVIPPDLQSEMTEILTKIRNGQHFDHYQTVRRRKDGKLINVSISVSPIYTTGGALYGASSIGRDITASKQSEEKLHESEEKYRSIYENSNVAILFTVPEGKILSANTFACNLFGMNEEEVCATGLDSLIDQNDTRLPKMLEERNKTGKSKCELTFVRKDGSTFEGEVSSSVFIDSEGNVRTSLLIEDLTEQRRAEVELRKLSRAIEQSPASIVITDTRGDIEYVNPKFVQVTGYSLEEAIGQNPRILKSGERPPEEYKQLWDMITTGKEWRGEFHNKKKNGELYWEFAVISPVSDVRGVITHFIAIKEDITERKQIEQALQYEHTLLRTLIDNIPDTIYSKDTSCRKTIANAADLKNMRVHSEAEVIGKDDFAFYPKDQAQEFYDDDQRVLSAGDSIINKEECIRDEHGQERWLLTNKLPLRDKTGTIIGLAGVGRDITERKKAEEALRRSEENFRTIFESNSSALAIIEADTIISMVNDAYCQMSGYTRQEAIGMSWTQQIPPDDLEQLKEFNRRRLLNPDDAPDRYEFKFFKKGGEIRHGIMSISFLPTSRQIIASFLDITERKQAEELVASQRRRLSDIIDGTNVGTWEWNIQTGEKVYNERWTEMLGYSLEELAPVTIDTWQHLVHPDDVQISNSLLEKHLHKELEFYECELRLRHKNGQWIWILDRGKIVSWSQDGKPLLMSGTHQDITRRKNAEAEREKLIQDLKAALADVRTLSGLLPICSSCKKIRDDNGYWQQVESYVQRHSDAQFTHGLCPDCIGKYFPDYAGDERQELKE
jgi:PAS domain S-box-containing protein